MKKLLMAALAVGLLIGQTSCDEESANEIIESLGSSDSLSESEVVEGLKTALRVGTDTAVANLNVTDGYYADVAVKILFPEEAAVIEENIGQVPGGKELLEEVVKKMNRAAEEAAGKAKPIFVDAILDMTVTDGFNILNGEDSAATSYLRTNTSAGLRTAFQPDIKSALDDVGATTAWNELTSAYNTVAPFLGEDKIEYSLEGYVTTEALDGLFLKVADEEKAIRLDPIARVTEILERVFGSLDDDEGDGG